MILFQCIRWQNFLSTGNLMNEINFLSNKTTLIVGPNGSGKSTLLDAITFVLFNKPFRKINKPQLLNSITNKELLVEIEFLIGTKQYVVKRGIKPNIFEIYCNNVLINQDSANRDYQEFLETEILKMNYKTFCQVVVLGSASYVPFMQLPAGQRREIIEDLLNLEIFTTMNSIVKTRIADNENSILSVNSEKKIIQAKLELMEEYLSDTDDARQKAIVDKQNSISKFEQDIKKYNVYIKKLNKALVQLNELPNKSYSSIIKDKEKKLLSIKFELRNSKKILEKEETCSLCKQEITEEYYNHLCEIENAKTEKLIKDEKLLNEKLIALKKDQSLFEKNQEKINQCNHKINEYLTCITPIQTMIETLKNDIKILEEKKNIIDFEKISQLKEQMVGLEHKYTELYEERNLLSAAHLVLKDGGIKSKMIKQYIPIINKFINKFLSSMDFYIQFELNEQFEETLRSRYRDEFSYWSFSEGEKMRINLSVLFTWRAVAKKRSSVSTNLLIMDEVFDSSMDINGTEEFIKILNSLTTDTNTFIISHRTGHLYDKFEKVITFSKINNFSKIV